MKKIRVALIAGKMVGGGVESLILSIIRHINKDEFSIDLLIDKDSTIVPVNEINKYGVKIIYIPPYQSIFKYLSSLKEIFSNESYDIVHANISSLNMFPLMVAKICGVPVRISHNHNLISPNAGKLKNLMKFTLSFFSNIFPNYRIAPTKKSGKWFFKNKNFFIIRNGVENDEFIFDINVRNRIRKQLEINDETVLMGSFGRMISSKNIDFLLDIMPLLDNQGKDFKLLLIGNGPYKNKLETRLLAETQLKHKIIFLDSKNNINEYYSALDLYLFPSTAEAFGMAAVESQINGLETIVSEGVPDEAQVMNSLFIRQNGYKVEDWSNQILGFSKFDRIERYKNSQTAKEKAFSSTKMVSKFEELYRNARKIEEE